MKTSIFLACILLCISCATPEPEKVFEKGAYYGNTGFLLDIDSMGGISAVLDTLQPGDYLYDLEETANFPDMYPLRKAMKDSVVGWIPDEYFLPKGKAGIAVMNAPLFSSFGGGTPAGTLNAFTIVASDSTSEGWMRIHSHDTKGFVFNTAISQNEDDLQIARKLTGLESLDLEEQEKKILAITNSTEMTTSSLKAALDEQLADLGKRKRKGYWQEGFYYPDKIEYSDFYWQEVDEVGTNKMVYNADASDYRLDASTIKGRRYKQGMTIIMRILFQMNEGTYDIDEQLLNPWNDEINNTTIYDYDYSILDVRKLFWSFSRIDPYLSYGNQMQYVNPQFIEWLTENMIPYPTEMMKEIYHNQFRDFFRFHVLAYTYLNAEPGGGMYENAKNQYMSIFDEDGNITGGYYNGAGYLASTYRDVKLSDASGVEYGGWQLDRYASLEAYHVIGFWLRRHEDFTHQICWKGLSKVMKNYDIEWFTANVTQDYLLVQ